MAVLADSWARRLKTCLEHATRNPIGINETFMRLSRDRSNVLSLFTIMMQDTISHRPSYRTNVDQGCITLQVGVNTVEIRVPLFTGAELDVLVDLLAGKLKYALLIDAWNGHDNPEQMQKLDITIPEKNSIKERLDLDLIERGLHVIPRAMSALQISCNCTKFANLKAHGSTASVQYCEHVFQALPAMLVHLDSNPSLFLLFRGISVDDLIHRVDDHIVRVHAATESLRHSGDLVPEIVKIEPSIAGTTSPAASPAAMLDAFWSYHEDQSTSTPSYLPSIVVAPMHKHPFDAPDIIPPSNPSPFRAPPARIRSILTSIYEHMGLHEADFQKMIAAIASNRKLREKDVN
jgi:hypothetical protein